jgi:hypothetical protein
VRNADTKRRRARTAILILVVAALSIAQGACAGRETKTTQLQTPVAAPTPQASAAPAAQTATEKPVTENRETARVEERAAPDLSAPEPDEVRRAVARVYEKAVTIDEESARRAVVGDFNGDGSADIAVVVHPSRAALAEINSEVANWIIEDPRAVVMPDVTKAVHHLPSTEERVRVEAMDALVAVIHGHEETGWRNTKARQSYLLRNAAGAGMRRQARAEAKEAMRGKNLPRLQGDVISETLGAEAGVLYWTGAKYGWLH